MLKNILINDRWYIYPDGVTYDTLGSQDIPGWIFELKNKLMKG